MGRRVAACLVLLIASGCGAEEAAPELDPCAKLNPTRIDLATAKAYGEAAAALRASIGNVNTQFYYACKAMNDELGLEAPRNTYDACQVLRARVESAIDADVEVGISFDTRCWIDIGVQAACESKCQLDACDATTECVDGDIAVGCAGECSGACDGPEPDAASCQGTCHGDCSEPTSAATCTGAVSCPASAACHDACRARAQASVTCSTTNAVAFASGDPELEHAIEARLDAWIMLDSLSAALEEPIFGLDRPMLEYMQAADVRSRDEEDCFVRAYGDLAVAIMALDTCRDAKLALPIVAR